VSRPEVIVAGRRRRFPLLLMSLVMPGDSFDRGE
jgi:hypothetical protein